jgi:hypothetical protein
MVVDEDQILAPLEIDDVMWIPKDLVSARDLNISEQNAPLQIMFILMSRKIVKKKVLPSGKLT